MSTTNISIDRDRAIRFAEFMAVGGLGAVIDIVATTSTLAVTHYLIANLTGFVLAVSFNFTGNWYVTFDQPAGSRVWQYLSYVGLHSTTFALRAAVIAALVEIAGAPVLAASLAGIAVAAIANFIGSEWIFEGDDELWFDAINAVNHASHVVYHSRLRQWLRASGLYDPVYRAYVAAFGLLYRDDSHTISVAGASAEFHTERSPETVSVLHTVEKERPVLRRFLSDIRSDDVVWDVGANLGVFAALAAQDAPAGKVVAFEPFPASAERCRENLQMNGGARTEVKELALGNQAATVGLEVERDETGTQTPAVVGGEGDLQIQQVAGDDLNGSPDVIKVDVEGAESAVLAGLSETLSDVRLIYVETHDGTFHDSDSSMIRDQLERHGFEVERIETDSQHYFRGVSEMYGTQASDPTHSATGES
jgi:FkbM family methyltransferase